QRHAAPDYMGVQLLQKPLVLRFQLRERFLLKMSLFPMKRRQSHAAAIIVIEQGVVQIKEYDFGFTARAGRTKRFTHTTPPSLSLLRPSGISIPVRRAPERTAASQAIP